MITMIYDVVKTDDQVSVSAVIEDVVLTSNQTLYDPPEYGPALCRASFSLEEGEVLPEDNDDLIEYLENLDLEWELQDNSDDYLD